MILNLVWKCCEWQENAINRQILYSKNRFMVKVIIHLHCNFCASLRTCFFRNTLVVGIIQISSLAVASVRVFAVQCTELICFLVLAGSHTRSTIRNMFQGGFAYDVLSFESSSRGCHDSNHDQCQK